MTKLILSISDNYLRVLLNRDGNFEYCRTFDIQPLKMSQASSDETEKSVEVEDTAVSAFNSPYLIFYDQKDENQNPWGQVLKKIVKQIKSEINQHVDSIHLIMPSFEVEIDSHQLPKMSNADVEKIVARKITAETKDEFPPVKLLPSESDPKIQNWFSLYIPTTTINDYRKIFASAGIKLSTITTHIHAMIDAFRSVKEAIFNAHAIFEIQRGVVEAYYISNDGLLHFQKMTYTSNDASEDATEEDKEKSQKHKIFKIINTVFGINSYYHIDHPNIPVQMVWVCGLESGLEDIAAALKDAMGVEAGIAPAIPTGNENETGYVPLIGYASALQDGVATNYTTPSFWQRFPLRKTYGVAIYSLTAFASLIAVMKTEQEYKKIRRELPFEMQQQKGKKMVAAPIKDDASYLKNLDAIKKKTANQFVFYDLFRELANNLPESVHIDSLEYSFKDDKGVVSITAFCKLSPKGDNSLQLFMNMLDASPNLKSHQEPTVSTVKKGDENFLKVVITAEVKPFDKKS